MSESIEPQPTESLEAPPTRRRSGGAGPRVFISYRRDDCLPHANLLATTLRHRLDADVCLDIDSIPAGADYPQYIASEVALSDALIVMIGDEWIDAADADGRRRLDNPKDWVRLEIKSALERNITVIPALVEGAPMPDSAQLPDELAELADRNAVRLRDDTWSVDFTALADGISVTREPPPAQRSRLSVGRAAPRRRRGRSGARLLRDRRDRPAHRRIGFRARRRRRAGGGEDVRSGDLCQRGDVLAVRHQRRRRLRALGRRFQDAQPGDRRLIRDALHGDRRRDVHRWGRRRGLHRVLMQTPAASPPGPRAPIGNP